MGLLFFLAVASGLYLLLGGRGQPSAPKPTMPVDVPPLTPEIVEKTTEMLGLAAGGVAQAFREPLRDAINATLGYCSLDVGQGGIPQQLPDHWFWVVQPARPGQPTARDTLLQMYGAGFAAIGSLANIMPLAGGRMLAFVLPEDLAKWCVKGGQWAVIAAPAGTFGQPAASDSVSGQWFAPGAWRWR